MQWCIPVAQLMFDETLHASPGLAWLGFRLRNEPRFASITLLPRLPHSRDHCVLCCATLPQVEHFSRYGLLDDDEEDEEEEGAGAGGPLAAAAPQQPLSRKAGGLRFGLGSGAASELVDVDSYEGEELGQDELEGMEGMDGEAAEEEEGGSGRELSLLFQGGTGEQGCGC